MKFLIPLLFILAVGCSTVQTQGTRQIDAVLSDGSLDVKRTDTPQIIAEKKEIKAALIQARSDIDHAEKATLAAEKKAQKNEKLASQAIVFWAVLLCICIVSVLSFIAYIMRRVFFSVT
jgi:hypothetical protein